MEMWVSTVNQRSSASKFNVVIQDMYLPTYTVGGIQVRNS